MGDSYDADAEFAASNQEIWEHWSLLRDGAPYKGGSGMFLEGGVYYIGKDYSGGAFGISPISGNNWSNYVFGSGYNASLMSQSQFWGRYGINEGNRADFAKEVGVNSTVNELYAEMAKGRGERLFTYFDGRYFQIVDERVVIPGTNTPLFGFVQPDQNGGSWLDGIKNWWNSGDLYFKMSGSVDLGLQAGGGLEVNGTKLEVQGSIASVTLVEGSAEQVGSDTGPWYYNGRYIGQNGVYGINQSVAVPFLGYEHTFDTKGYGHIRGTETHAYSLGIFNTGAESSSINIGFDAAFLLGIHFNVEFGIK